MIKSTLDSHLVRYHRPQQTSRPQQCSAPPSSARGRAAATGSGSPAWPRQPCWKSGPWPSSWAWTRACPRARTPPTPSLRQWASQHSRPLPLTAVLRAGWGGVTWPGCCPGGCSPTRAWFKRQEITTKRLTSQRWFEICILEHGLFTTSITMKFLRKDPMTKKKIHNSRE